MAPLEREDLAALIARRGFLSAAETRAIVQGICEALSPPHAQKAAHGALRPEAIVLGELDSGPPRVRLLDPVDLSETSLSRLWSAPEQVSAGALIGPPADVWALGLIAFFMLTGRLYWRSAGRGSAALASEIMNGPLLLASSRASEGGVRDRIPFGFDYWFSRCVSRVPTLRWSDAGSALEALVRALPEAPKSALNPEAVVDATDLELTEDAAIELVLEPEPMAPRPDLPPAPEELTDLDLVSETPAGGATAGHDAEVAACLAILTSDPFRVDPYHRLFRLRRDKGEQDRAFCIASVLVTAGKADPDEQLYFEERCPPHLHQITSPLDNELWIWNLFHEEEDLYLGKIFEMIAAAALKAKLRILDARKERPILDRRFRQDPATSTITFARTFGLAARALGLPAPLLYVRSDVPGGLVAVPSEQPTSIAGQTVLSGFSLQELMFIIGHHLTMYRGEHYIKVLFPTLDELTVLALAGVRIASPAAPVPPHLEETVTVTAGALRNFIKPIQLEGLRLVVRKFIERGGRADVKRWSEGVCITKARAGLLLAGDLRDARKILVAMPRDELSPVELMKELMLFSISDSYYVLRRALGVAID